ncbi:hypothetical protein FWJ25_08650 [Marinobacter salinexigens]|uniref:Tetratricopeptide repeat protein n=1 Tax=Marinobacter salinexigens TaxID=2919747 RepID=A0A5B0VHW7_9GAMM|nr:hypothetical protein [Marinobacter salinexigens]KAA1174297.1 hypothetical protein FWJ25_08650 [Marinobacter salinexigens]
MTTTIWLLSASAIASPAPIESEFHDDTVLATLPAGLPAPFPKDTTAAMSRDALADKIQSLIKQARASGDPRFLGYADRLFQQVPDEDINDRLRVLRATLAQSLHRFEDARADLNRVLADTTDRSQRIQARLTLANLELVQGRYTQSLNHCQSLDALYPGLVADSCRALVQARTGDAPKAYRWLSQQLATTSSTNPVERVWAEGTLAEIAAQQGLDSTADHWSNVITDNPDDLYARAQLADWLLMNERFEEVLTLTSGYEQVDALSVIRVITLKKAGDPGFTALAQTLRERFEEAQWRGSLLHKREFSRFKLDVEGQTDIALKYALENWQTQREPLDTRLALRAAMAGQSSSALTELSQWLDQNQQVDARYPEGY